MKSPKDICQVNLRRLRVEIDDDLQEISDLIKQYNLTESEIEECFEILSNDEEAKPTTAIIESTSSRVFVALFKSSLKCFNELLQCLWKLTKTILFILLILAMLFSHLPTQKLILRNAQDLIHPLMRQVRLLSLPVLKRYNHLTSWHEELCLLKNPFYPSLDENDCWPCVDIRNLVDLTALTNHSSAYCSQEKPFVVKDAMSRLVTLDVLKTAYKLNKNALDKGTAKFESNSNYSLDDYLINSSLNHQKSDLHIEWKMNRVSSARIIRLLFERPYFVPQKSEVALQRHIFISGPEADAYRLPLTDFANVWLAQGQGFRLIVLDPSESCRNNCSSISVLLEPKHVLYYNWLYYVPRSLPANLSDELSITFMGSFY